MKIKIKGIFAIGTAAALTLGMTGCGISGLSMGTAVESTLDNLEGFSIGDGKATGVVKKLSVEWVSGDVNIQYGDVDNIVFQETSDQELNDSTKLEYKEENGELKIHYHASVLAFGTQKKTLNITIPKNYSFEELETDCVSANVNLKEGVTAREVNFKTVSGEINSDGMGDIKELDVESVSGNIKLKLKNAGSIDISTTSGNVELGLTDNIEFSAQFKSVSGDYTSDIATTTTGNYYVKGAGTVPIEVSTVSGDLHLYPVQ